MHDHRSHEWLSHMCSGMFCNRFTLDMFEHNWVIAYVSWFICEQHGTYSITCMIPNRILVGLEICIMICPTNTSPHISHPISQTLQKHISRIIVHTLLCKHSCNILWNISDMRFAFCNMPIFAQTINCFGCDYCLFNTCWFQYFFPQTWARDYWDPSFESLNLFSLLCPKHIAVATAKLLIPEPFRSPSTRFDKYLQHISTLSSVL